MKNALLLLVMTLGLAAGTAAAADQKFEGEIVRVAPDAKSVVVNVKDEVTGEVRPVTVAVDNKTRAQGFLLVSELKEGAPVEVEAGKPWFSDKWVARKLIYRPSEDRPRVTPSEKARLHELEGKFAHGEIGDVEYETKRQTIAQ